MAKPDSLEGLQSSEQVALLDAIDNLRSQGVSHYNISLPQLIVCGDQSSGKSSVLEGLTRLRFPTKDGLCTTFATEVALRNESTVNITCTITPGPKRTKAEIHELAKFKRCFSSREDFSFTSLLEEAKAQMALGTPATDVLFRDDILQIRYAGPDLPSFTIVDLPGLIQSQVGENSKEKKGVKGLVDGLVKGYMRDTKSIILAVVSAKNDLENQAVFDYVKESDPNAIRTMGIITKPDTLDASSDSEARILRLAQNNIARLELKWHVVKNRNFNTRDSSDAERDESEKQFFSTGVWASLPRQDVGIDTLRTKLSGALLQHIRKELPSLIETIQDAIMSTESSLKTFGKPRESVQHQRTYLTEKAELFQRLTDSALSGSYGDPFFTPRSEGGDPAARLRTEIQNLNIAFADTMYRKGHTWNITEGIYTQSHFAGSPPSNQPYTQDYDVAFDDPRGISRTEFIEVNVASRVQESRPAGLPSIVNPWVIVEVFREQSQPWEDIAKLHLSRVFEAVKNYVNLSLRSLMDSRTFNMLIYDEIEPELDRRRESLEARLTELLVPYKRQDLITYDPRFTLEVEDMRARRRFNLNPTGQEKTHNVSETNRRLLTESRDHFSSSEVLDLMQTYYKSAIAIFINNVVVLGIECCLVANLAAIFSPSLVSAMDEAHISLIASESEDIRTERASLVQKLEAMKKGKRTLDIQARDVGRTPNTQQVNHSAFSTQHMNLQQSQSPTPTPRRSRGSNTGDGIADASSRFDRLSVSPTHPGAKATRSPEARSVSATPTKPSTAKVSSPPAQAFAEMRTSRQIVSDSEDDDSIFLSRGLVQA